jgi:hypothetical protein
MAGKLSRGDKTDFGSKNLDTEAKKILPRIFHDTRKREEEAKLKLCAEHKHCLCSTKQSKTYSSPSEGLEPLPKTA